MNSYDLLVLIGEAKGSYVLAAERYRDPAQNTKPGRRIRRTYLIAAVIILILALVGCAASIIMNLDSLKLGEEMSTTPDNTEATEVRNVISMQGFVGSSSYQAAKEWYEFDEAYDSDQKILQSIGNKDTGISEDYVSYGCYTQEMVDKVDEICEKYGLVTLGMWYMEDDVQTIFDAIGISGITANKAAAEIELYPGYFYADGTFQISGETKLTGENRPWLYPIEYEFRCVMKSSFDRVFLNIGNIESYEQWTYALADGTEVLLAVNPDKALIIADKEEFFVTVNILNPRVGDIVYGEMTMDHAALEAFADTFDFSFLPQRADVEAAEKRAQARETVPQETLPQTLSLPNHYAGYADYISSLAATAGRHPENYLFALRDLDDNGVEEMLIGCVNLPMNEVVTISDGEAYWILTGGGLYLCEGNIIEREDWIGGAEWHSYYHIEDKEAVTVECIMYAPASNPDNPWFWSADGAASQFSWEPITEEEYNAVLEKYVRMELEMTPITEFPMD